MILRSTYFWIVACAFFGACYAITLPLEQQAFWLSEQGPIEGGSAIAYIICAIGMCLIGGKAFMTRYYYIVILTVLFALRELDFDKRFTTMGILKSKFYISNHVPVMEKLIGLCIVSFILFYCIK